MGCAFVGDCAGVGWLLAPGFEMGCHRSARYQSSTGLSVPRSGSASSASRTRDEIGHLLVAAPPRYRTLLATALFSGLRQSELLGLRWRDIDFADEVIHIRNAIDRQGQDVPPKTQQAMRDPRPSTRGGASCSRQ
jgi:integrase